jgi:hypothetical protein
MSTISVEQVDIATRAMSDGMNLDLDAKFCHHDSNWIIVTDTFEKLKSTSVSEREQLMDITAVKLFYFWGQRIRGYVNSRDAGSPMYRDGSIDYLGERLYVMSDPAEGSSKATEYQVEVYTPNEQAKCNFVVGPDNKIDPKHPITIEGELLTNSSQMAKTTDYKVILIGGKVAEMTLKDNALTSEMEVTYRRKNLEFTVAL